MPKQYTRRLVTWNQIGTYDILEKTDGIMSEYIHKSHKVSVVLYHIVCPTKYRWVVISEEIDQTLKEICEEISKRYEIRFLEIGREGDHVQSDKNSKDDKKHSGEEDIRAAS
jgi:hypothetical protein